MERFETFTVLLNRISRNIRRIKNQEMTDLGLRSVHISCLYYLYRGTDMTAAALCDHCEEDKATISRALLYLEEQGYLAGREAGKSAPSEAPRGPAPCIPASDLPWNLR